MIRTFLTTLALCLLAALAAAVIIFSAPPARSDEAPRCDLALVLANDASGSIKDHDYATMHEGIAAALRDPEVVAGLEGRRVYVMSFEFSRAERQFTVFDWTAATTEGLGHAARATETYERQTSSGDRTSFGAALRFARDQFDRLPEPCLQWVIDVVADGDENSHPFAPEILAGFSPELQVNVLAIKVYSNSNFEALRHGFGAFVVEALTWEDFPAAFRRKLLLEIM